MTFKQLEDIQNTTVKVKTI